ncbi:hypothetical protein MH215_10180 [Paenibacillus sp. ACRSA]|uniref:hypothetical protein n=1 Tax=Paenibacillus sp. ACRSA TaxID=2918211 RepID=UPI001EF6D410|nr:hypothetical protein [Paenibacillus sp. ACRSA]MCG7377363.1 hypothetical protein [Paenibacillus sp. ACRSA]
MKRSITVLLGVLVISFVLLLGVNILGFPVPIVIKHSNISTEGEFKYHEGGDSKIEIMWWED